MKHNQTMTAAALLLTLLLSTAATVSCGGDGTTQTTTADTAAQTSADIEAVGEERVKADLPERDFGGETITFYGRIYDGVFSATDIFTNETDGEPINDALFARTVSIEDTYNVKLATVESGTDFVAEPVKTLLLAGDDSFDAIVSMAYDAASLSAEGMLWDLHDIEHLDLSQSWWSKKTNDSMTIAGRQYYATGDIFVIDNKATRIFYFNKDMIAEFDLDSPYALVRDNAWTLDKFVEYNKAVGGDLNGDNVLTRTDDRYGTMAQGSFGSMLYLASGNLFTAKDENDMPYISCDTDRALSVMNSIAERVSGVTAISVDDTQELSAYYPDNLVYFMEGRVLFAPEVLLQIENMRGCDVDIGILPPPKFDASQDGYYCFADGYCVNVLSVPVTNTETDKIGFLAEAMAAESVNELTPAYYELALTDKYMRDQDSVYMLDLILDSVVLDNAEIFSWGNLFNTVSSAIADGGAIASTIASIRSATEKDIEITVSAYQAQG
ncbi:MAG: extracellular solute-binding protein [Ruminococcaceae bacterium]|nr:extracellular solute-binding protein [Oscillospiraceae bacterium]